MCVTITHIYAMSTLICNYFKLILQLIYTLKWTPKKYMARIMKDKPKVSEKTLEIVRRIKMGAPLKYDCDVHPALLIEVFDRGDDIAMFCSTLGICRSTFYNWIDEFPEFKSAYNVAREMSRTKWEAIGGLNGVVMPIDVSFNTTLWSINMRNRFGYTEQRKVKVKGLSAAETPEEMSKTIMKGVEEGKYTSSEATALMSIPLSTVKIQEHTEIKKDMKDIKKHLGMPE
jgi:hypothetical protein